eukprot:TRINITY_DN26861_c0_g2_i3.p1 TRINITY_DN26861_c0_g2~~TRINITY_DN26861_c0_g2_i3.p1  ORF type:complete len:1354 (+),score=227.50 TRINITY_DN26861_c0_g2_i3:581-4063(+)
MLFVVFNFMMSIKADLSHAALRMGRMETVRYCVSWLSTGIVFFLSPSAVPGTKEDPLPAAICWLVAPLGVAVFFFAVVPGLLCLLAPQPYREDRFPAWDLSLFGYKKSFVLLVVSECLGGLVSFPTSCYVSWWLANGWDEEGLSLVCTVIAVVLAVGIFLWSQALSLASIHGFSLLVGVAVFLAPPALLATLTMQEASTFSFIGRSHAAMVVCGISLLFQGVQSSALWSAKVRILGSRWRLLSYCTVSLSILQFCTFLSPILCELFARRFSATFITRNQMELATAVTVCIVPISLLQYGVQLCASFFIHRDMGGSRSRPVLPTSGAALLPAKFARKLPIAVAATIGGGLLVAVAVCEYFMVEAPLPFHPIRQCRDLPSDWTGDHCRLLLFVPSAPGYALNQYGQETSAKLTCLEDMLRVDGDTFEVQSFVGTGSCRVLRCKSEAAVRGRGEATRLYQTPRVREARGEVYSRHCSIYGQGLVMTHLFEWSWKDIAKECTGYLGPAGFDAVQVSPPAEHILGSYWWTRYQPVSYRLDSRSGSETEFASMVATCRKAGVQVVVDTVLNHMAGPVVAWPRTEKCDENGTQGGPACEGWAGTLYGNRRFPGSNPGFTPDDFHHFADHLMSNCALPPWTGNRHLCDLQALPDLDTEKKRVQDILAGYLKKLYRIGVTMIRVDAAMLMYPNSLALVLEQVPFDYVVQEYYPDVLQLEPRTYKDATKISPLTNFQYGTTMARILFDYEDEQGRWVDNTESFGELLKLNHPDETRYPDFPLEVRKGLQFLDNHDQQRERWKVCTDPEKNCTVTSTCGRVDFQNNLCRPIYKNGLEYWMATAFTLAWPYGDSIRIMSSFAWRIFPQGPPGTRFNASRDQASAVWTEDGATGCRQRPTTSPVSAEYDRDTEQPWVCEHRWQGVPGLVRLRRSLRDTCGSDWRQCEVQARWSEGSRARFEVHRKLQMSRGRRLQSVFGETLVFVAMKRGYNSVTERGSKRTWNLAGVNTSLPGGEYCDLASALGPVPPRTAAFEEGPLPSACASTVVVHPNGTVARGVVFNGGMVALHVWYRRKLQEGWEAREPFDPSRHVGASLVGVVPSANAANVGGSSAELGGAAPSANAANLGGSGTEFVGAASPSATSATSDASGLQLLGGGPAGGFLQDARDSLVV